MRCHQRSGVSGLTGTTLGGGIPASCCTPRQLCTDTYASMQTPRALPRGFGQIGFLQIIPRRYTCNHLSTHYRIPSYTTYPTLGCGTSRQSRGREVGDRIAGIKTFHIHNPSKSQRATRIAKARVSPTLASEACDTSATLNRVMVDVWTNHNARRRAPTSCTPAVT